MRILLLGILLATGACESRAVASQSEYSRYVGVAPEVKSSFVVDAREKRFVSSSDGALDSVVTKIETCDELSEFICFFQARNGITFAVPRSNIDGYESWNVNGNSFKIVNMVSVPSCGTQYMIQSSKNARPIALFFFSYSLGLQLIMGIESIETISLDQVSGDVYRFGSMMVADGLGFGGTGVCTAD